MHISISQTDYQRQFLSTVNNQSKDFFKSKFKNFNVSGELDHSLTNTIFNLINKEIASLIELFPSLCTSYTNYGQERKNQRKLLLSESQSGTLSLLTQSHPFLLDYKFARSLNKVSTEYQILFGKFQSSMAKLLVYMGVYEELYLVNTLSLSYDVNYSLSFDQSIFTFFTRNKSVTFKVLPIFFLVKYLFSASELAYTKRILLEHLLTGDFQSPQVLLTISDMDQIEVFFEFCNMQYLSDFALAKLNKGESIQLPKVLNISQLRL